MKFVGQGFQKLEHRQNSTVCAYTDRRNQTHYYAAFAVGNKEQIGIKR